MRTFALAVLLMNASLVAAEVGDLDLEARAIETMLIAPCCWNQPVAVHYSGASEEIKKEIREMLGKGMNRQQILDFYISKYGARILSAPEAAGFNALAYLLPVLFLLAAGLVAVLVIKRLRSPGPLEAAPAESIPAGNSPYTERLDRELWG